MLNRNVAAPWLYAAGGMAIGLVGFKAVSALKRRNRERDADVDAHANLTANEPFEQQRRHATPEQRGENAAEEGPHPYVPELLDEELEAVLSGESPLPGDAYDAVAPDDLASEYLSRATEASVVAPADEALDAELAELLRDAGMSVVGEETLNSASPEQFERESSKDEGAPGSPQTMNDLDPEPPGALPHRER